MKNLPKKNIKNEKTRSINGFIKWRWRDSNPRPNKQYASFLHA